MAYIFLSWHSGDVLGVLTTVESPSHCDSESEMSDFIFGFSLFGSDGDVGGGARSGIRYVLSDVGESGIILEKSNFGGSGIPSSVGDTGFESPVSIAESFILELI